MNHLQPTTYNLQPPRRRSRRRSGFTLIEAALTTVIVGTGVLSIVAAQQAYHQKNNWATRTGEAVLLANELRELTMTLPQHDPITGRSNFGPEAGENGILDYDDLDDFAGVVASGTGTGLTFNPPVNALRQSLPELSQWTQRINVTNVTADHINSPFTQPLGSTPVVRVDVTVLYTDPLTGQTNTVTELNWIVTDE
ncbi:MAG: hypothetical protein AAGI68_05390 [Planctomycetota bacterium]